MKTFGTMVAEARRALGMSQKELASKVKKEDGQAISPQYLNDVERDRRNPPSEYLIVQMATALKVNKDVLCAAAGTVLNDVKQLATTHPEQFEEAFRAFRKKVKS
jgi:transcriptional regulator with XRE-family HTH domain